MSSPSPIAGLPPAEARPVQWRRLRTQLAILDDGDPARVLDAAYSVGDAIGGMSDERHLRRLARCESGRALLESRVSLVDALADHEALRALPAGSLGQSYLAFSELHGLKIRKLIESQHAMSRDHARLDPVRQWMNDRLTVMHDLWHVLAGYDATPAGESALMGFSLAQRVNDRALPIFILMSVTTGKIRLRDAVRAIRRGARAVYLPAQPFEPLLALPLATAREHLAITPPEVAHAAPVTDAMLVGDLAGQH